MNAMIGTDILVTTQFTTILDIFKILPLGS